MMFKQTKATKSKEYDRKQVQSAWQGKSPYSLKY